MHIKNSWAIIFSWNLSTLFTLFWKHGKRYDIGCDRTRNLLYLHKKINTFKLFELKYKRFVMLPKRV